MLEQLRSKELLDIVDTVAEMDKEESAANLGEEPSSILPACLSSLFVQHLYPEYCKFDNAVLS